jgi:hypothetical protein
VGLRWQRVRRRERLRGRALDVEWRRRRRAFDSDRRAEQRRDVDGGRSRDDQRERLVEPILVERRRVLLERELLVVERVVVLVERFVLVERVERVVVERVVVERHGQRGELEQRRRRERRLRLADRLQWQLRRHVE